MTIGEAIETVDELVINQYEEPLKIKWLGEVDAKVYQDVISTHEGETEFEMYNQETSTDTELLIQEPYTDVYVQYLIAKINYYNGEMGRYNNAAAMYNNMLFEYAAWYNRNHMPLQKNSIRRG